MKDKWTIGIKFFGYLTIILPFGFVIGSILAFLLFSLPLTKLPQVILNHYITEPLNLLALLAGIILGVGVLRLRKWALGWVFIVYWTGAVVGVMILFLPLGLPITAGIWVISISLLYVWFFTRPKVKEQFK